MKVPFLFRVRKYEGDCVKVYVYAGTQEGERVMFERIIMTSDEWREIKSLLSELPQVEIEEDEKITEDPGGRS